MAQADRDLLGRIILPLLTLGGIALKLGAGRLIKDLVGFVHLAAAEVQDAKEDYLSQLPEDILSSILSRLSLEDAARMSFLSRRWKHLFASMTFPTLDFHCRGMFGINHRSCPSYQQKFLKGVNQVLQLYSGRKVDDVSLTFCFGRGISSEFDQCMHSLSRLDVESLSLYFDCGADPIVLSSNPFSDPSKLFKFSLESLPQGPSLKHLLLYHCSVQPSFAVRFNSISTLNLLGVLLESGHLESILSSCLNLSELQLERCRLPRKLRISGIMTSVFFLFCGGLEVISLHAKNLHSLACKFYGKVVFHFSFVPMLEHVMIQSCGDAPMSHIFGDFARDLPTQVKSLTVTAVDSQIRYFPTEPEMFRNLRELSMVLVCIDDFDIVKISPLLGACPLLQYLNIEQGSTRRGSGRVWSPLTPTYHTELKEVTLGGFLGGGPEIEFALYILRSATVLERMFVSPIFKRYSGGDEWKKPHNISFDERKRSWIQSQLHRQAISRDAVVIIQ